MSVNNPGYKGAEQPIKGIALICLAVLLFASHDTLSKYLSGFYPILMVVLGGFVGVLIVVRPGGALFTPAILLPLCSALCFGFYQLLTRLLSGIDSPTTSNFLTGILNSLIMTALVPFFWSTPTLLHGLFMIGLGTCGMLGHMLLTQAFRHAAPAMLAPFSYGQILFAGIYGYLIFDHTPDSFGVIGITVICLSGLAVAWGQRKR